MRRLLCAITLLLVPPQEASGWGSEGHSIVAEIAQRRLTPAAAAQVRQILEGNASETVTEKPFFREPFKHGRCLIPASGYYEWHDTPDGKQPYYFTRADGEPATIAGLWDRWHDKSPGGETIVSCTMVITEPNDFVRPLHDRMPVILERDQFEPWLFGEAGTEVLKPAANDVLRRWPVSKRVNSSKAPPDDPTLMEEIELSDAAT